MTEHLDYSLRDPASARLKLRGELLFTPQLGGGAPYYVVEDPTRMRFYRLGYEECAFASLLDGRTSVREAMAVLSTSLPSHRLTEQDALSICRWLVQAELVQAADAELSARPRNEAEAGNTTPKAATWAWGAWNPLAMRVPLARPDRVFRVLAGWLGWLNAPPAIAAWLAVIILGVASVASQWDRFAAASHGILAPDNWLWLAVCWVALKVIHESWHGVVCRRYGGSVREVGLLFVLLAPLAYVDVTSSWRFRSRWRRIHVAAAGMYAELFVAAVAAILWRHTPGGWLSHLYYNVIVMAGVSTLVFNANPLMKFDGYYILSDLLNLPNLSPNGQQLLLRFARRWALGLSSAPLPWSRRATLIIGLYGVASLAFRVFATICLIIAAATMFHGAGVVLAIAGAALYFGAPLVRLVAYLVRGRPGEVPQRMRFLAVVGIGGALAWVLLAWAPWPGAVRAPAVVEFAPYTVIRAGSAGFLREIHVQNGEQVAPGQLLAVLENRELECELADLELAVEQSDLRCRRLRQAGELAEHQAELKSQEALLKQLRDVREEVKQLAIRAPCSGVVVRRNLDDLCGLYLQRGDEIVAIGDAQRKDLRLSIAQDDLTAFAQSVGAEIRVCLAGLPTFSAPIVQVNPRAALELPFPALASVHGGPLLVTPRDEPATETRKPYQLLAPRFTGVMCLTNEQSAALQAGQRGVVFHRRSHCSIGEGLWRLIARWVRDRLERRENA